MVGTIAMRIAEVAAEGSGRKMMKKLEKLGFLIKLL